jgi:hypothetical protein
MSVALAPPELVARWKSVVKPAGVFAVPVLETVAFSVTAVPAVADVGVMEPAVRSGMGAEPTVSELLQVTVLGIPAEVMTTVAVFVPLVEYALVTELPEPESPSVPLHEYVYEPLPPDGTAVQVADWFV